MVEWIEMTLVRFGRIELYIYCRIKISETRFWLFIKGRPFRIKRFASNPNIDFPSESGTRYSPTKPHHTICLGDAQRDGTTSERSEEYSVGKCRNRRLVQVTVPSRLFNTTQTLHLRVLFGLHENWNSLPATHGECIHGKQNPIPSPSLYKWFGVHTHLQTMGFMGYAPHPPPWKKPKIIDNNNCTILFSVKFLKGGPFRIRGLHTCPCGSRVGQISDFLGFNSMHVVA